MSEASNSDPARIFETTHVVSDLKRLVLRGGIMKALSQGAKFVMRVAGLVVMARLVTPDDYGVFAMVATLTGLLSMLKDAGLSMATVQSRTITHEAVSTLFWINVATGLLLAAFCAALGPIVAAFYGDPRIAGPIALMGLTFLFSGLSTQHAALLQRQMRFKELESIGVAAQAIAAGVMLASAYFGAGYWAMVLNILALRAANTLLVTAATRWRPGRPGMGAGAEALLVFGRDLSGYNVVSYLQRNLDNILIGRFCSALDLGLYVKAYGLLRLPIMQIQEPISAVVVPALSRLHDDPIRYRGYFLKALKSVVFLGMPLVAFTSVAATSIISVLLGVRWLGAVPIFQALIPAAFLGTADMITGWVLLSLGRADLMLRLGTISFLIVAAAFICGLPFGPVGVAAAYSVAYTLLSLPSWAYALKRSPVSLRDVLGALWRPAGSSVGAALVVLGLMRVLPEARAPIQRLAIEAFLYCLVYALSWAFLPGGRAFVANIASPLKGMLRGSQKLAADS